MTFSDIATYELLKWAIPILLAIIGFVGVTAINYLIKMSNDLHEIKLNMVKNAERHDALEKRVDNLEETVYKSGHA